MNGLEVAVTLKNSESTTTTSLEKQQQAFFQKKMCCSFRIRPYMRFIVAELDCTTTNIEEENRFCTFPLFLR